MKTRVLNVTQRRRFDDVGSHLEHTQEQEQEQENKIDTKNIPVTLLGWFTNHSTKSAEDIAVQQRDPGEEQKTQKNPGTANLPSGQN